MSTSLTVDRFLTGNVLVLDYWLNQASSPVITAVTQVQDGATFTITGTGFSGSGGDLILLQQGDRVLQLTPSADSTTSITSPILDASGFFKTQPTVVIVQNVSGVQSQPYTLPLNADGRTFIKPAANASAWPITLPVTAAPDKRLAFSPDLQQGHEVLISSITGPGTSLTSIVVNPDGTFVVAADVSNSPRVDSFSASGMDGTKVGAAATQLIVDSSPTVNVPLDLVGETYQQALSELAALGVNIHIQGYAQDALIPLGDVVSTFPAGGFPVLIGGTVEVILSLSTSETQVPNMIGEVRANAETDRSNAQCTGRSYPYVDGNNSGTIIGQSVTAQTIVAIGTPVDLAYSSNLPPDIRRLQINQAIAQVTASNLNFALNYVPGGGPPNYTTNQSPLNTPVSPGDVITIDVVQNAVTGEDAGVSGPGVSAAGVSDSTVSGAGVGQGSTSSVPSTLTADSTLVTADTTLFTADNG